MLIRLDIVKLTQASAFVLKQHGGVMTRMRLLKLLYIADRELLAQTHRPLTGDRAVAMQRGPVLSHVYQLLKGETDDAQLWQRHIGQVGPFTHQLIADPGVGKLSRIELSKLLELVHRFWLTDDEELSEITHAFPEWVRNRPDKESMRLIPTEHILEAVGLGNDIERLRREAQADAELDALLASAI